MDKARSTELSIEDIDVLTVTGVIASLALAIYMNHEDPQPCKDFISTIKSGQVGETALEQLCVNDLVRECLEEHELCQETKYIVDGGGIVDEGEE